MNSDTVVTPKGSVPAIVGMAATESCGSDRYAGTIVEVTRNGREVAFVWDVAAYNNRKSALLIAERDGDAEAILVETHRLESMIHRFTLKADGVFRPKGRSYARMGRLTLGKGEDYRDPSF